MFERDDQPDGGPAADAALVEQLRGGDAAAYEALVRQHGPRMLAVARRLLNDEADAADAVQDAFVSVFRSISRFQGQSALSTWLHRITVNAALMRRRGRQRAAERPIEDFLPRFLDDGHQAEPAAQWREPAAQAAQRREVRELVQAAIAMLPEAYRNVLQLRDIEGMDTAATAEVLGIQEGAVKVRLHRARQALRGMLDSHFRTGSI